MSEQESTLDEFAGGTATDDEQEDSERRLPEIDSIPEDWELVTVEDISTNLLGGGTPSKSNDEYWNGTIPWASVKDLNGIKLSDTEDHITETAIENSTTNLIPANSIIISTRMTVGEPFLNQVDMAINQDMKALIPDYERANSLFLVYSLWDKDPYLKSLGRGTTVDGITTRDLSLTHLGLSSIEEQREIATVLYTVDQAIEKTKEIISQLERTKQGICQKLFSEGYKDHSEYKSTKYGRIPVEWDIEKLSEVTNQIQAGGTPDTNVPEYYGGDVPWVKTGELSQYRLTKTEQKITEKGLSESTARLFSPSTVLIAMYGATTGEVCFLEIEAATNQACCGIVTTDQLVPEFLFHQLNYYSDHLESLSAGSGQQNISKGIIQKFDVIVPPVEEQNNIIDVLNSIDNSIVENGHMMERYQRLKRGLMQDLLSGRVRTTDTNMQVPDEVAQYG